MSNLSKVGNTLALTLDRRRCFWRVLSKGMRRSGLYYQKNHSAELRIISSGAYQLPIAR